MGFHFLLIGLFSLHPTLPGDTGHNDNAVFQAVLNGALKADDQQFKLPTPTFRDEMTADEQAAALRKIGGSDRAMIEMKSDSISAPHKLFLKDTETKLHIIRSGDLYFTLHVDLDSIQPKEAFKSIRDRPVEAGNMKFDSKPLSAADLRPIVGNVGENESYSRETARLLDRIIVSTTDQVVVSRSAESLVIATRTDPRFDSGSPQPNQWQTVTIKGATEAAGTPQPFAGGAGYAKLTRLKGQAHAIIVESHFVYAEPIAWFNGAPILRSKFSLIANDQLRRLRSELKKAEASKPKP